MLRSLALFFVSALLLASSSWYPETYYSFSLEWFAIFSLVIATKSASGRHLYFGFFIFGIVLSGLAYYWVPNTLSLFGGFPFWLSLLLFSVFCMLSSGQFLLCAWLYRRFSLKNSLQAAVWCLPLAWFVAETLVPRVFPWRLSYMQIVWPSFSSLAEIVGTLPLSFLLLYWAELLVSIRKLKPVSILLGLASLLLIPLGASLNSKVEQELTAARTSRIGLIQGNLSFDIKGDSGHLSENLRVYQELSLEAQDAGAELLVWPETVVTAWAPRDAVSVRGTAFDPYSDQELPLLYGGLSLAERDPSEYLELASKVSSSQLKNRLRYEQFNTAFFIKESGLIVGRYDKRVLMPFGEYLPFRNVWPAVRELSPYSGDFTAGTQASVFQYQTNSGAVFSFSPLICYEDMVPEVAREAVLKGANFLVNMSNDAWYGKSVASKQHHLLAQWRSIENRRALVRVTNDGYTALVSPTGKTVKNISRFVRASVVVEVPILERRTFYSQLGDRPARYFAFLCLALALFSRKLVPKSAEIV